MPEMIDTQDCLNGSTILRRGAVRREEFDPTNQEHLRSLECFVATGRWGDVQFFTEAPYIDVPMTVLMKFTMYQLWRNAAA